MKRGGASSWLKAGMLLFGLAAFLSKLSLLKNPTVEGTRPRKTRRSAG
jgi:hypothetical protein